ncbi:hypothetical protein ACQKL0_03365 [Peribacillus sp. NPDC097264]|uniref:hypothetical protein n=1 Tax=Peribacillus sp. NPDC097264 TaxID=3390616 RepID=UPI003D003313
MFLFKAKCDWFKVLLDHQKNPNVISAKAYNSLKANADAINEEKSRLADNPIMLKRGDCYL